MDHGRSFEFAPTARAVLLAQARNLADRTINSDRLNVGNVTDDLKHVRHPIQYKIRRHTCQTYGRG